MTKALFKIEDQVEHAVARFKKACTSLDPSETIEGRSKLLRPREIPSRPPQRSNKS